MTDTVYTDEVVETLVADYNALVDACASYEARSEFVNERADELGVKPASVRAKLVNEKVYVAKEKAKTSSAGQTKEQIAGALSAVTGKDMSSLSKASKQTLTDLWDFLIGLQGEIEIRAKDHARAS